MKNTHNGLGFSISGGLFTEYLPDDHGIFITNVSKGSVADSSGKIHIGDRLLSVNDKNLEYVTHDDAVAAIASSTKESNEIILTVAKVTKYTTEFIDRKSPIQAPKSASDNNNIVK